MNIEEMEARIQALEEQLKTQEKKLAILDDIEAIKRLQKAYNYYVEHMMGQEVIDCFADSKDVVLEWLEGTWLGKDGVERYFLGLQEVKILRDLLTSSCQPAAL